MVLDATVAGASADAYLTVEDADGRASRDLGEYAAAWSSASTEAGDGPNRRKKEAAIRRATEDVEMVASVVEMPYDDDQARVFPRADDELDAEPYIVERVLKATYLQAVFLFSNAEMLDHAATRRARGLTSFSEPNVSGSLADRADYGRYAPGLERLLAPLADGAVIGIIVRA
jgi:hypothetical protein